MFDTHARTDVFPRELMAAQHPGLRNMQDFYVSSMKHLCSEIRSGLGAGDDVSELIVLMAEQQLNLMDVEVALSLS